MNMVSIILDEDYQPIIKDNPFVYNIFLEVKNGWFNSYNKSL